MDYLSKFKSSSYQKTSSSSDFSDYVRPDFIVDNTPSNAVLQKIEIINNDLNNLLEIESNTLGYEEPLAQDPQVSQAPQVIRVTPQANIPSNSVAPAKASVPNASYIFEAITSFVQKIRSRLQDLEKEYIDLFNAKNKFEHELGVLSEEHEKQTAYLSRLEARYFSEVEKNKKLSARVEELEQICSQQNTMLKHHKNFVESTKRHLESLYGIE